jgi:hypothetical protein
MNGEFLAPARRVSFFLWQDRFANLRSVCGVVIDADEAAGHTLHISDSILTGDRLRGLTAYRNVGFIRRLQRLTFHVTNASYTDAVTRRMSR